MIFNIQYARASVCTVLYVCVGDGDDVYGGGGSVCVCGYDRVSIDPHFNFE